MTPVSPPGESTPADSEHGQDGSATATDPGADASGSPRRNRFDAWFGSTLVLPLFVLPLGAAFAFLSRLPLWHTDLWGHLAYGRLIWETRSLPATEPFMPLARGVELIDTAWLSQIIGYLMIRQFGVPGLQFLAAACVTATAGILAWLGYRKTGSIGWTLLGLAAFTWLSWKQLFNGSDLSILIRPQMAGMVAFAVTLAVVVGRPRRWHWFVIPLTYAAWANLHGSFPAGLTLLGVFAIGRAGDVLRRTDKFGAIFADWPFWRLVLLTEIAAVAVLLNPYGLRLYAETWLFLQNANLRDLVEWEALTLRMNQGQATAGVAFALMFAYRMTPRRLGTGEVLALLLFGGLTLWTSRMIVWWAPIAAYCLMVHSAAIWKATQTDATKSTGTPVPGKVIRLPSARRGIWSVVAIGLAWSFFSITPFASVLMRGRNAEFDRAVSSQTPVGAARHLAENPPAGQIFNSYEIGDYLIWSNPNLPVFVTGHAHLVPREVWRAYMNTVRGGADWHRTLDQFGVEAVVLDRPRRESFIELLLDDPDWELSYRDHNSAVLRRVTPLR